MMQASNRIVGVDIGGTKIAAGIADRKGEISARIRTPMVANRGPDDALAAVLSAIHTLLAEAQAAESPDAIAGIGICAPGPLDPRAGIVINPPNLPCWRNFPLAAEIEKAYRVPVKIENDANAAALAESNWGAGRGYRNIFYVSLGTGIGTGIVFDGKIYNGRTGAAAEGGHMSIDCRGPLCGCGKPGCIEILAAGPAIARRARTKLTENPRSIMLDLAKGLAGEVTSEIVGQAYAAGDPLAKEVLLETANLLSLWLSNIIDLLEPDAILIGGGAAVLFATLFDEIENGIAKYCINSRCREIPLLKARYGEDAGIAGGAALCVESELQTSESLQ